MSKTYLYGCQPLGDVDVSEPYCKRFAAAVDADPSILAGLKFGPVGFAFWLAAHPEDPADGSFVKGRTDAEHARALHVSVRTIKRWATDLERAGIIRRVPGGYHLLVG